MPVTQQLQAQHATKQQQEPQVRPSVPSLAIKGAFPIPPI